MEPKLGTPLTSEEFRSGAVFMESFTPKAEYAWDTGPSIGRYLEELKRGRLVGRRCPHCERTFIPPRSMCELCFRPAGNWVVLEGTGRINTFSLCYVTWDMQRLTEPQIPAVIEVDGASEGHGILHLIGGADPGEIEVGMRVRAVWKPEAERQGAITDIEYWEPIR